MRRVTFESDLVRVDSEPLDAAVAAAVLAGAKVRDLPAKATDAGDGSVRLTIEIPCNTADLDGGRAVFEQRALALLEEALRSLQHRDRATTAQPGDGDVESVLAALARTGHRLIERAPRTYSLAPAGGGRGFMLEVLDCRFMRLSASALVIRPPTPAGLEAALRFACELNHRLRITRVIAETGVGETGVADARPHARLTAECVVPLATHDATAVIESAAAGVTFARARLTEAARGLADAATARIFLELRGIALEDRDRSERTGSPSLPRAVAL